MATKVRACELEYHDSYANSHKFYRIYELPQGVLVQWGRVGSTGQFKLDRSSRSGYKQYDAKVGKGYQTTIPWTTFEIDDNLAVQVQNGISGSTGAYGRLAADFWGATRAMVPIAAQQEYAEREAREEAALVKKEEQLKSTLLKMAGKLRPEGTPESTPEPDNMEARLAAAMSKAKEKK